MTSESLAPSRDRLIGSSYELDSRDDGASTAGPATDRPGGGIPRKEVVLLAVLLGSLGTLLPLYDPDLPMHLAIGEWIAQHGRVPRTEPFAWTREGAPYFAYSWLPQLLFYFTLQLFGAVGLRLLQGVLLGGVFAVTFMLGRASRCNDGASLLLAAGGVLVAAIVAPSLRPQIVLLIAVPFVWVAVLCARARAPRTIAYAGLVVLAAVTVNSHLFFPLLFAPLALLLCDRRPRWRLAFRMAAALTLGCLLSPYTLDWPAIWSTNFAGNALLEWPSPIAELQPGFIAATQQSAMVAIPAVALCLLPWSARIRDMELPQRRLALVFWVIGLIAFALAVRLLLVWWLLVLPFAAAALRPDVAGEPEPAPRRGVRVMAYGALFVLIVLSLQRSLRAWAQEGDLQDRRIATLSARAAEPAAAWLESNVQPGVGGKIFTVFNYGSYLTWRLPAYSASIDTRTIFPDSVAAAEALIPASANDPGLGPWRWADVAIVPTSRRVAAVLDTASGWQRVGSFMPPNAPDSAAIWVRERWWAANSKPTAVLP